MHNNEIKRLLDGGMGYAEIGHRVGRDAATLAAIVNGEISDPSASLLAALQAIPTPEPPERRALPTNIEGGVRLDGDKAICGYAAVYYDGTPETEYPLTPRIRERIHPGAFAHILESRAEMLGLYHHDESQFLGKRSAGTLTLEDTPRGLAYSIPYDATDPVHQTVAARIRRKDAPGSSFTFKVSKGQDYERRSDGITIRNLTRFDTVADVGPTHLPTYGSTTAEFRALREIERIERLAEDALRSAIDPPTPIEIYMAAHGGQR